MSSLLGESRKGKLPLDDLTFEILRAAVRVSKDYQIRRLDGLRARLAMMYPNNEPQREATVQAWAQYVRTANSNGVERF